jgi:hypothetical protein
MDILRPPASSTTPQQNTSRIPLPRRFVHGVIGLVARAVPYEDDAAPHRPRPKTGTQPRRAVARSPGAADKAVPPSATACDPTYPCFSTLLYSLKTVVPLINLRQAKYWTVTANHISARLIRGWLRISAILSWILVTFTGGSALTARR